MIPGIILLFLIKPTLLGSKIYETSWPDLDVTEIMPFLLYGKSDCGICFLNKYGINDSMFQNLVTSNEYPQIKNDQTTLYRTVFQFKALDDAWQGSKDADNDGYFQKTDAFTWAGFYKDTTAPTGKYFWDNAFGPGSPSYGSIYVCDTKNNGMQDAEWNGTDTNIPHVTTDAPPDPAGEWDTANVEIDNYATATNNWEDVGMGFTTGVGTWGTLEWWFKVCDEFVVDDAPEVKFYNVGKTGDIITRFTFKIISGAPPTNPMPMAMNSYKQMRS